MGFYNAACGLMGDEHVYNMYSIRHGFSECRVFGAPFIQPAFFPNVYSFGAWPTPVCYTPYYWTNYINYYAVPPVIAPHYIFSFGTWDYGFNYYNYYTGIRSYVTYVRQWVPTPPLVQWLLPCYNYSAQYNLIRCARAYRDPWIYAGRFQLANRYYPNLFGYQAICRSLRYSSRNWSRRRW